VPRFVSAIVIKGSINCSGPKHASHEKLKMEEAITTGGHCRVWLTWLYCSCCV